MASDPTNPQTWNLYALNRSCSLRIAKINASAGILLPEDLPSRGHARLEGISKVPSTT
jgi:hypothetical protein